MRNVLWVLALLLAACGGDPGTGPVEVKWDRDACERCRMVLSDRLHAAQIRATVDGRSRVFTFDDFGCAVIWLEAQPWKEQPGFEFWVTDYRSGAWIDARSAWYQAGQHTPMAYGLGAAEAPAAGDLDYAAAKARVFAHEAEENRHAQHLETAPAL